MSYSKICFEGDTTEQISRSGATFETVYSTYSTGGKKYDIMRVYATPTSSNMFSI